MRRLLVLRPEPGASATVRRAEAIGLEVAAAPLFEIEAVEWEAPDPAGFDGLLLTSANAVRLAGPGLQRVKSLPVHAVGQATADAATEFGLHVANTGRGGVDELLQSLGPDLRLLHLCGVNRKTADNASQVIAQVPVYRSKQIEAPDLSAAPGAVALVHSPRAGRRFAELVDDRAGIAIVAISPTAAEAAGGGWESIAVADRPTDEALLALASRLCNKPAPQ